MGVFLNHGALDTKIYYCTFYCDVLGNSIYFECLYVHAGARWVSAGFSVSQGILE